MATAGADRLLTTHDVDAMNKYTDSRRSLSGLQRAGMNDSANDLQNNASSEIKFLTSF